MSFESCLRVAVVGFMTVATLVSGNRVAASDLLAEQTFDGGSGIVFQFFNLGLPNSAVGSVASGRFEITGAASPGPRTGNLYFSLRNLTESLISRYPALRISYDFVAQSDVPFAADQLIVTSNIWVGYQDNTYGYAKLTPNAAPTSASADDLVGDGSSNVFAGDFMVSLAEVKTLYTATVEVHVNSANQLVAIDNFRVFGLTLPGDANNDGVVNAADLAAVDEHFGSVRTDNLPLPGDANHDGRVDGEDYFSVQRHFGDNLSTIGVSGIPEPAGLALLLTGGLLMLRRRGR